MLDRDFLPRRYAVLISIQKVKSAIPAIYLSDMGGIPSYLAGVSGLLFGPPAFCKRCSIEMTRVQLPLHFAGKGGNSGSRRTFKKKISSRCLRYCSGGILTFSPE